MSVPDTITMRGTCQINALSVNKHVDTSLLSKKPTERVKLNWSICIISKTWDSVHTENRVDELNRFSFILLSGHANIALGSFPESIQWTTKQETSLSGRWVSRMTVHSVLRNSFRESFPVVHNHIVVLVVNFSGAHLPVWRKIEGVVVRNNTIVTSRPVSPLLLISDNVIWFI